MSEPGYKSQPSASTVYMLNHSALLPKMTVTTVGEEGRELFLSMYPELFLELRDNFTSKNNFYW